MFHKRRFLSSTKYFSYTVDGLVILNHPTAVNHAT